MEEGDRGYVVGRGLHTLRPSSQEIPKLPFRTRLALMGPRDFRQAKTRGSAQSIEWNKGGTKQVWVPSVARIHNMTVRTGNE